MVHLLVVQIILNVNLQDLLSKAKAAAQATISEPKLLVKHENGNDIYLKNGRFGPYLQYEKVLEELELKKSLKKRKRKKKTEK